LNAIHWAVVKVATVPGSDMEPRRSTDTRAFDVWRSSWPRSGRENASRAMFIGTQLIAFGLCRRRKPIARRAEIAKATAYATAKCSTGASIHQRTANEPTARARGSMSKKYTFGLTSSRPRKTAPICMMMMFAARCRLNAWKITIRASSLKTNSASGYASR